MLAYRNLVLGLRQLDINPQATVMVHANIELFGPVRGGVGTFTGVLLSSFNKVMMPAFTYKTMVIPGVGPGDNAIEYGSAAKENLKVVFFQQNLPVDSQHGVLAEALRKHPRAERSSHPVLSFSGVNANRYLDAQCMLEPLAPVGVLVDDNGWVLLIGVDHTANISIHWAERCAGRKQFIRWALTHQGVVECPGMPGCSRGFNALAERLSGVTRISYVNDVPIKAIPARELVETARQWLEEDSDALLCEHLDCACCSLMRETIVPPKS